jgi:ribonuclease HII
MPRKLKTAELMIEQEFWKKGYHKLMGTDEAGRGPWAGPIVVGVVCLPHDRPDLMQVLEGVRDSKKMTKRMRARLVDRIKETAVTWGIGSASSEEIDEYKINPATKLAMIRALEMAELEPDYVLMDSFPWKKTAVVQTPRVNIDFPYRSIKGGDNLSLTIAAASVIAKVWRDEHMIELDEKYPDYGFRDHKGYGTAKHLAALKAHGVCPIHRAYYAPVREIMAERHQLSLPLNGTGV